MDNIDNDELLAQKKFKIIEPFLNKEKKLKEIEKDSNISYATLKRWVKAYKENGIDGLEKKERIDKNNYKTLDSLEVERIKKFYLKNRNLSVTKLYENYGILSEKMNISYPTFYRIINNLDSFVKTSSGSYIKNIETAQTSYGIFQFPIYFPLNVHKIYFLTLYFEISTLRIVHFSFDKDEKTFRKLFQFIRDSILIEGIFPKEIFLTDTVKEVSKKSLRECSFESSITFLIDEDYDYIELKRFCRFLELDLSHEFYGKKEIELDDVIQFLNSYIYLEEHEKKELEFYYQRKLDFFLTRSIRKVYRYGIRLKNYIYYHEILKDFENEILEVRHSNFNENSIIIYENDTFLCEAFKAEEF